MRKLLKILVAGATIAASAAAFALDIQEAKNAGWVGEQRDGYVGLVAPSAPAEARTLVAEVNAARRDNYRAIAGRTGAELRAVELLAAEKALQKTQSGHYVQTENGAWTRK